MARKFNALSLGIFTLIVSQPLVWPVAGDLFTSVAHMEDLLALERELLSSLNDYIAAERERCCYSGLTTFASQNLRSSDHSFHRNLCS